jgi:hypothetical protein
VRGAFVRRRVCCLLPRGTGQGSCWPLRVAAPAGGCTRAATTLAHLPPGPGR